MITESVILSVKPGLEQESEACFKQDSTLIASIDGYLEHRLQTCIEHPGEYLLTVEWETLHTVGFRKSKQYVEWKEMLHHFYEPFPNVLHDQTIFSNHK
ncbi:antibiotic biosynthesis monooxygenase family protein [Alkalihalobacillus pseudalcaliphilus]|uniref:antibiotic biosynthesis monooxygenase family protein n=1 Tax=Alkalihalobacillus pseudalcaliphilus TaxID=79884 RepID=UPI00064D7545|nr:antibiotic biosynthesis monooxygenase [Alkalihalobacillus pseudalcaliphilus]KMK75626.1 antibiotic biosynthesis monooxygenase [Alkalihalobacillus pseudalcaliphilus]